jgi:murein DD-endopeptidase MepM/ murein hydrolase activator NlpD
LCKQLPLTKFMRQQLRNISAAPQARKRRERVRQGSDGITITPLRGFFLALLFLGIPTVSLGGLCFTLLLNNLHLSKTNNELSKIATEVKADVDSLGEEIDSLQVRAGVSDSPKVSSDEEGDALNEKAFADFEESDEALSELADEAVEEKPAFDAGVKASGLEEDGFAGVGASDSESGVNEISVQRSSLAIPMLDSTFNATLYRNVSGEVSGNVSGEKLTEKKFPPQGGLENAVDALDLLKEAQRQLPKLNKTLDTAVKPALEETLAEEAAYPTGKPVVGSAEVSSEFGVRKNPFGASSLEVHEGMDFVGAVGDRIVATGDGVATLAGNNGGYGLTVTIDHGFGYETLYAHMSEVKVKVGDRIKRGQIIGFIGSTGRSSGPHLHYSLYKNDKAIDPRTLLKLSGEKAKLTAEKTAEKADEKAMSDAL